MSGTVVALVPMREHSVRVPMKNRRPFCGEPLYRWVVRALLASPRVTAVAIDTDSAAIAEDAAREFPGVRVIPRPRHLQADTISMNEVILHDASVVGAEVYLQTHSTNPLLRSETITRAVDAYFDARPRHDSLFSVTRLQTRLYDAAGRPLNHDPAVLMRTQDLPPVFEENSCLYVFDRGVLERRRSRLGEHPLMFELDPLEAVDIDEEHDFRVAELLMQEALR
jgi:CMP-N-acetylneuraminic acid synthetase